MKSRKEYFTTARTQLFAAFVLYAVSLFLLQLILFIPGKFATLFVIISVMLMFAVICTVLGLRNKTYLFCPKCGSKRFVTCTLFGIPAEITCDCPDCGEKIELYKSIRKE